MQILKIKKRGWFGCLGVHHWLVDVVTDDGAVIKLKCWASIDNPSREYLIYDINKQLDIIKSKEKDSKWNKFLEEYK